MNESTINYIPSSSSNPRPTSTNHQRMPTSSPSIVACNIGSLRSSSSIANTVMTTSQLPPVAILRRADGSQFTLPPAPQRVLRKNHDRADSDALSASSSADGSMSRTSTSNSAHGMVDTPDPVEFQGVLIDPFILKNVALPKDRPLILKVEAEMSSFISSHRMDLRYPGLNSYERLIVHRLAGFFKLIHVVDRMKTVILSRTIETEIPPLKLRDIPPVDPSTAINAEAAKDSVTGSQTDETSSNSSSSNNKTNVQIMQRNGRTPSNNSSGGRGPVNYNSSSTTPLSPTAMSPSPSSNPLSTFEERQEEYNRARERIFSETIANGSTPKGSDDGIFQQQQTQQPTRRYTDRSADGGNGGGWYRGDQSLSSTQRPSFNTVSNTTTNMRPSKGYQSNRSKPQYTHLQHPLPPTPTRTPFNSSNSADVSALQYQNNRPYRPQQQHFQYQQQSDYRPPNSAAMGYMPHQAGSLGMVSGQQSPMGYIPVQQPDGSVAYQPVMYPAVMPVPVYFPPPSAPAGMPSQQQQPTPAGPAHGNVRNAESGITPTPNGNYGFGTYPYMIPQQPMYSYPANGMMMPPPSMSDPNIGSNAGPPSDASNSAMPSQH
ncbi:hypothetical protein SeLEV6574_g00842 [Synchytrium endobioticum]|nr:hypothetical protein SeLEV6574_g00842 [Synchytrium endobioticum]